jgi:hypothetical protein
MPTASANRSGRLWPTALQVASMNPGKQTSKQAVVKHDDERAFRFFLIFSFACLAALTLIVGWIAR